MESVIKIEEASFSYGEEPLLREVSFSVQRGDFAGVVGENGAGKSTLLRLLLGELAPTAGEVRLFGQKVQQFHQWKRLCYVPQNGVALAAGFPANVLELVCSNLYGQIGFMRLAGKAHKAKALEALDKVGMKHYAKAMVSELSGGQMQRVLLARALVPEPELLLLDEPASGIDRQTVESLYEILKNKSLQGTAVVMVTHDTQRAADFMNRVFCLEQGTIVELDSKQLAHELAHRHRHPECE